MKSLVIDADQHDPAAPGGAHIEQRDIETRAGECRVGVTLAGICGTDLQILRGYAGFSGVPGHEFVGVVETAPDGDRHWIGRRVVGEINVGCRDCDWCRADAANHCPTLGSMTLRPPVSSAHATKAVAPLHERFATFRLARGPRISKGERFMLSS